MTFLYNFYSISARLFIIGGKELTLRKGTAESDQTAMGVYALGLKPLGDHLQTIKRSVKHIALADDLTCEGKPEQFKIWWDALMNEILKYGYYPKPFMSFLINLATSRTKQKELDILV